MCARTDAPTDADGRRAKRGWDFGTATNPRNSMVLAGLPINRSDFLGDYLRWPDQDYARSGVRGEEPEKAWANFGAHLAQTVADLVEAANGSGIGVLPKATKADFAQAFVREAEVVILVTHWRGSRLDGRDLLCDPETCAAAIS